MEQDRVRWDAKYVSRGVPDVGVVGLSTAFAPFAELFPITGRALDIACGQGSAAVWLAQRGMTVWGLDVSPVAIHRAGDLARIHGLAGRCHFEVADLDAGLPPGAPANVVVCQRFRDVRLDEDVMGRLAPDGLLAISALSEVDATPGPFRVEAGELRRAFAALDVIADGEAHGEAWLLARRRPGYPPERA